MIKNKFKQERKNYMADKRFLTGLTVGGTIVAVIANIYLNKKIATQVDIRPIASYLTLQIITMCTPLISLIALIDLNVNSKYSHLKKITQKNIERYIK